MRFSDADPLYQDRVEGVPVVAVMIPKSKPTHIDGRRHAVAPALILGQPLVSKAKSVMLTDAGLRRAEAACRRLFEADE